MEQKPLLEVRNLCTEFKTEEEIVKAVDGVSFTLHKGQTIGIVGVGIRVCDKIARIDNLKKTGSPSNESLMDSYIDIVGYAMIATMLQEESFKLKLAK